MEFKDFLKKLGKDYNPDRAYKLYLQTQITIIQEVLIAGKLIERDSLERIEKKIFDRVADNQKN